MSERLSHSRLEQLVFHHILGAHRPTVVHLLDYFCQRVNHRFSPPAAVIFDHLCTWISWYPGIRVSSKSVHKRYCRIFRFRYQFAQMMTQKNEFQKKRYVSVSFKIQNLITKPSRPQTFMYHDRWVFTQGGSLFLPLLTPDRKRNSYIRSIAKDAEKMVGTLFLYDTVSLQQLY